MNASLEWAERKMQPKIAAAREEGKREGRKLGWLEATEELMVTALQLQKLGLNRDHDVIKACADHLREKSGKLP
jgi:flagellar biosynthesis/type III secretory pathway protein FliH